MAHQTSLNGGFFRRKPAENVISSLGELGGDVSTLVELQAKLAGADLKDALQRSMPPFVLLVAAGLIVVATLPVFLIAAAYAISELAKIPLAASLLIVGATAAVLGGIVLWIASVRFLRGFESFRRSREELVRNISWVRTVISQSTRG